MSCSTGGPCRTREVASAIETVRASGVGPVVALAFEFLSYRMRRHADCSKAIHLGAPRHVSPPGATAS